MLKFICTRDRGVQSVSQSIEHLNTCLFHGNEIQISFGTSLLQCMGLPFIGYASSLAWTVICSFALVRIESRLGYQVVDDATFYWNVSLPIVGYASRCKVTHFIWPLAWNCQLVMKLAILLQRPTFHWLRSASAAVINVIITIIIIVVVVVAVVASFAMHFLYLIAHIAQITQMLSITWHRRRRRRQWRRRRWRRRRWQVKRAPGQIVNQHQIRSNCGCCAQLV